jgi:peroxiredoxin Q/BCP
MLKEGNKAPAFNLPGNDGNKHRLSDYLGKKVVLYFYPRDNTPGCTTEACDFRDNMAKLKRQDTVVFGVSKDSIASHEKFVAKHELNFILLADEDTKVHEKYGCWGEKSMYGKKFMGCIRSTYLIDEKGKLAKSWIKVRVKGHVDDVMESIKALS